MPRCNLLAAAALLVVGLMPASPATATTGPGCYRIVDVPEWDVLNVRKWGSARAPIVLALSPKTYGIISSRGACKSGWCPVNVTDGDGTRRGWIKGKFLAPNECP
ncbi:MAG: hypothetical protein R3D57_04920 [Hyphomicrobiaceae bacterium]